MWPNPQETANLVTFTEETLNEKLQFLWIVADFLGDSNAIHLRIPNRVKGLG